MEIHNRTEDGILIISMEGRLDAASAPVAEGKINKALEGDHKRLLFDLSGLEYLSSGGLRVILSAAKEMRRRDGKVVLAALKQYVHEIFEVSGFTAMIPIKDSIDEGLKALA